MRLGGVLALLLTVLVSCSDDSWELAPAVSIPPVAENLFVLESNDEQINKFANSLLLDEQNINPLELTTLISILGPSEPSKFILRNFKYQQALENSLDESKVAKKSALDDFYNIKYTLLFDYRKQIKEGVSKKTALKATESRGMALLDGVEAFNGSKLSEVIEEFIDQIDEEEFELSSNQNRYISKLHSHFLDKQKDDYESYEILKEVGITALENTKMIIVDPQVTDLEMPIQNLEAFKKRTKLSIYGGEVEAGPVVEFKKLGKVVLHKIRDNDVLKHFSCHLSLTAEPDLFNDAYLVSVPFFKDARKVTVSSRSKIYTANEGITNEEMVSQCEKDHFAYQREALDRALEVKAGEMVFQSNAHQCEANEDCKRWFRMSTSTAQRMGSHYICDKSKKAFSHNTCVVAGGKGSPCRVIVKQELISSGLGEVTCLQGLSCQQVKPMGWFTDGKIQQFASGICL